MSIGETIKAKRREKGLSQVELAEALNISQSMMCQIERGSKAPSLPLAKDIADALDCGVEALLGEGS